MSLIFQSPQTSYNGGGEGAVAFLTLQWNKKVNTRVCLQAAEAIENAYNELKAEIENGKTLSNASSVFVEKLSKIKVGMSEKELTNLFGQPQFTMNQSASLGMFGTVVGDVPENLSKRENWVFKTEYGEFQTIMQDGFVADMMFVNPLIEKLKSEK